MQISSSRRGRRLVVSTCAAAVLAAVPASAQAAPVVSDLRVEAGGVVVTNSSFPTDTQTVGTDTSKPACGGSGQTKTLTGPNAFGLLKGASAVDNDLNPVRISDKFSFGLLLCGVGSFSSSDSAFWVYKVNHVAPEVGAEAFKLKGGEEVLFAYQDTARNRNTGDELVLEAPVSSREGAIEVTVSAYGFNGTRKPARGARVFYRVPGGSTPESVTTDAQGKAQVRLADTQQLRAGRAGDIPSAPVEVCVSDDAADCPVVRGKRIYGSAGADRLKGSRGADIVRSGAGNDTVDVRGGEIDRVRCGKGSRDRVRMNGRDRATNDCEIVNGRRRSRK